MSAIYEIIALEGDCRLRVIYGDRSAGLSENPMQKVIDEFFYCNSAATYYAGILSHDLRILCDELVDEALKRLPGDMSRKCYVRAMHHDRKVDPKSTKFRNLCKDTCTKGT